MFIGHYGVAYALKPVDRKLPLGWLFLAVQFVDILWAALLLAGVEQARIVGGGGATPLEFVYYPFTHSLLAAFLWSSAAYAFFSLRPATASSPRGTAALVLGAAVFSHFLLDLVVHRPDLPLFPGASLKIGLGLWDYPRLAWAAEMLVFLAGFAIYWRSPASRRGSRRNWRAAVFAVLLAGFHTMTLSTPTPENIYVVGATGLAVYLSAALLAAWTDREIA